MKRICTQEEKELILKNKSQLIEGIYLKQNSGYLSNLVRRLISLFTSVALWVALMVYVDAIMELPLFLVFTILIILDVIVDYIFFWIYNSIKNSKQTGKFLEQRKLYVNGATVFEIYEGGAFSYIEDDVKDDNGNPIIMMYSFGLYEVNEDKIGERLLIVYDDEEYQIFKINDELKRLIPEYSTDYPLSCKKEECMIVAHPNMLCIEKEEQMLTETEKKRYEDLYVNNVMNIVVGTIAKCYAVIFVVIVLLCILFNYEQDGVTFEKSIPYAGGGIAILGLVILIFSKIGEKKARCNAKFVSRKEIIFESYQIGEKSVTVKAHEWINGKPKAKKYPAGNVNPKTTIGAVIYKLKNKNGDIMLLNATPVSKKKY